MIVSKTPVRDFYGKILGYIEIDGTTGIHTIRNFYMKILGRYDPKDNKTRDFFGRVIGEGDLSGMLINMDQNGQL